MFCFFGDRYPLATRILVLIHCSMENPPPTMCRLENEKLFKFARGPGKWISAEDLHNLDVLFGFPVRAPSLHLVGMACKLRVATYEIDCVPQRAHGLRMQVSQAARVHFPKWIENCHMFVLDQAMHSTQSMGITPDRIAQDIEQLPHVAFDAANEVVKKMFSTQNCRIVAQ